METGQRQGQDQRQPAPFLVGGVEAELEGAEQPQRDRQQEEQCGDVALHGGELREPGLGGQLGEPGVRDRNWSTTPTTPRSARSRRPARSPTPASRAACGARRNRSPTSAARTVRTGFAGPERAPHRHLAPRPAPPRPPPLPARPRPAPPAAATDRLRTGCWPTPVRTDSATPTTPSRPERRPPSAAAPRPRRPRTTTRWRRDGYRRAAHTTHRQLCRRRRPVRSPTRTRRHPDRRRRRSGAPPRSSRRAGPATPGAPAAAAPGAEPA